MSNNLSIGTSMQVTNDAESSKTIRPSASKSDPTYDKKGKSPMRKLSMMKKSKSSHHRLSVFSQPHEDNTIHRPRQPLQSIHLKREPMLCMRSVTGCTGTGPTQYNAVKETKFDLMAEKWRQVELVLTNSYISTYSASTMFWPKYRLEHRIYLIGPKRPRLLSLFLLSSLDYTFCLRYTSTVKKEPTIVTLTFKARSFLKCQEWYMQLYHMLPYECKHPPPQWCDVYIPLLDLVVNLPLAHLQDSSRITIEEVKEAVISIVQEEQEELVQQTAAINTQAHSLQHFGFCWTVGDRAEWIYWTHSASGQRMDSVICPQNIEKTHRLEFRPIEHTPRDIELSDQFSLKEPPPVEGFLMHITDFAGSTKQGSKQKMRYFASFDQYLFYIPTSKVPVPNMRCFINDDLLPRNIRVQPYISAISPYTPACTPEIEAEEISRRMQLMIEAKGMIDLTEVLQVKRTFIEPASPSPFRRFSQTQRTLGESSISDQSRIGLLSKQLSKGDYQAINQEDMPSNERRACLELVMENGLHIQLEVRFD
ncbi:hypothetical protein EDC96DRAFT_282485 [Choanephora cucurbitarum]|nr:hypothetical protein EDC96DRAFT_282485 [Choanephora cucurbitarum]